MRLAESQSVLSVVDRFSVEVAELVRRSGIVRVDLDELKALKEGAKGPVYAMAKPPFSEAIASDRILAEDIKAAKSSIANLVDKHAVLETRLTNAREQTARQPEPSNSLAGITLSAVGLFSICFAPTLLTVFMSNIQDAPLAWIISLAIAAAIGAFLVQVLLQPSSDAAVARHSKVVGFGLGIGFGVLRLSKADGIEDYLIATGLTVLECVAVAGLDWFAEKHRQVVSSYRISQAQTVALEQAIGNVKVQVQEARTRYDGLLAELKKRESEVFDVERVAGQAECAVEAAYRGAVNANQRLLEGGGGFALSQAF